jgi:hypothetical protein
MASLTTATAAELTPHGTTILRLCLLYFTLNLAIIVSLFN